LVDNVRAPQWGGAWFSDQLPSQVRRKQDSIDPPLHLGRLTVWRLAQWIRDQTRNGSTERTRRMTASAPAEYPGGAAVGSAGDRPDLGGVRHEQPGSRRGDPSCGGTRSDSSTMWWWALPRPTTARLHGGAHIRGAREILQDPGSSCPGESTEETVLVRLDPCLQTHAVLAQKLPRGGDHALWKRPCAATSHVSQGSRVLGVAVAPPTRQAGTVPIAMALLAAGPIQFPTPARERRVR